MRLCDEDVLNILNEFDDDEEVDDVENDSDDGESDFIEEEIHFEDEDAGCLEPQIDQEMESDDEDDTYPEIRIKIL